MYTPSQYYFYFYCYLNPLFKHIHTLSVAGLFLLLFKANCRAQTGGQFIEKSLDIFTPFTITQYSTKNGLPENQVVDLTSSKSGKLIVCTANGIAEYDGSGFKNLPNNQEYKEHIYYKVFWHEKTNRLFANEIDGTQYIVHPVYKQLGDFIASTFVDDSIFCLNYQGELFGARITELKFSKISSTNITDPRCITKYKDRFLIGTTSGIFSYYDKLDGFAKKLCDKGCFAFEKNSFNNKMYALNSRHVYEVNDTIAKEIIDISGYKHEPVCTDIAFTDTSDFFLATNEGLYEVHPNYVDFYSEENAFPTKTIYSLFYNKTENCLFVGTGDKGLLKLTYKDCITFDGNGQFLRGGSLTSIIKTRAGEILVIENGGNIYKLNTSSVEQYGSEQGYYASLAEINDTLYVGTWGGGIKLLKNKKLVKRIKTPQLPDNQVRATFKDRYGTIWVGCTDGLAKGTHSGNIKPYRNSLIKKAVIVVFYELRNGNLCIGTNEGFFILDKNQKVLAALGKKQGLKGREVRSFYEDQEGKIWLGTYGGGIYCYHKNKLTSINKLKNAMLSPDAFCILPDGNGYLYITSNHGLWCVKESELNDFYYRKTDHLIPFYFSEETGILNTEFNGGFQNSALKVSSGHMLFPSLKGLVLTISDVPKQGILIPEFNRLAVNDTIHPFSNTRLKRNTYSIEFHFSTVNFSERNNIHYQYKLIGSEKNEWSLLQKKNNVTFKMLPAGNYTFMVRALDAFNSRHPETISYAFTISPYFFETLAFKITAIVVFLILTTLVIRIRVNSLRKKAEEKERIKRQLVELELKAVQAQMNPHFIFNSLNSIKYHLSVNENSKADFYIDHFSSLLRDFLEISSSNFVRLDKEVQILNSYLELEKHRINPPFDFNIHVDAGLEGALVPTHLLQPLVENAVKHGINNSHNKCQLILRFDRNEEQLCIVIRDNGVGREHAAKINQNSGRASKGINLVHEKIRIVKELYNIDVTFEIEDKQNEQPGLTGTRVQLKLPLLYDKNLNY